jgi:hypothetical protein
MSELIDVAAVAVVPTKAKGSRCGLDYTRDDCLSQIILNVHYLAADDSDLGTAKVNLSDGIIADAMGDVHAVAVAAAEGNGLQPGDDNYPDSLNPQAAFNAAKNKIDQMIADAAVTTNEAMAEQLVTLLAQAGPGGAYPQKWGLHILKENYRLQVK